MVHIILEPLLPLTVIVALALLPAAIVIFNLIRRRRASLLRMAALVAFVTALLGPVMIHQESEPTQATLALIVDRSQSQKIGKRPQQTEAALHQVKTSLEPLSQFDIRVVEVTSDGQDQGDDFATRLIGPLQQAFADVPPARRGGAIIITDGQVHDIPSSLAELNLSAPINALITGHQTEYDRQIRIMQAPRFGLVGKPVQISFQVDDTSQTSTSPLNAEVALWINGIELMQQTVRIGEQALFEFDVTQGGNNIIELITPVVEGELTPVNNATALIIDGIRENLKTLLVSGEPHNGLRIWRDLLKSDPGVDLIHFTILRPPEKFDNTPTDELSLISFPTTELFVDKIDEFDLIILDRYQHYDILPLLYYDFIAEYVKKGGAMLLVAGAEYADTAVSLARTPLMEVLPAKPTGLLIERPFLPQLTDIGKKHPVTRDLEGAQHDPPSWGRWLRQIDVNLVDDNTRIVLSGVDDKPLMLLGNKGEGRIGMILSDQGWLWARGFEGGGPYANLYRRMAYWLLKQPELEEEYLNTMVQGNKITISRQTMAEGIADLTLATITFPSGKIMEQKLTSLAPGRLEGSFTSDEMGIFRIENGDKTTVALIGQLDAPELTDLISTTTKLEPLSAASGGNILRLSTDDENKITLPPLQILSEGDRPIPNRIILAESRDSRLLSVNTIPLYSAFLALFVTLLLLGAAWKRESQ